MANTSITKTALWKSLNFEEKYGSWSPLYSFTAKGTGVTVSLSNNIYTIHTPGGASGWGVGFYVTRGQIYVPYGYSYRITADFYMPTAHSITYDINNYSWETSNWSGNDHDEIATRYPIASSASSQCVFSIPATAWTTFIWGSSNTDSTNANTQYAFDVNDAIGILSPGESASTDWQMRNPRFIVYKDSNIFSSIGKDGTTHANQIYEI